MAEYRTADGRLVRYDWPTLWKRKAELEAQLAGEAQPGIASRRTQAVPTSDRW